jgi:hypothetical protein
MRIYLFDSWKHKFTQPLLDHWRLQGHEVETGIWWGPELVEWADVAFFYPVDNNLAQASKGEKPPHTRIIAEAVDADIYGGHWRKVNWDWVDGLVCMSKHMTDYMRPKLPESLPVYHVPGGVNLDKWTFRRDPTRNFNIAWVGHYWIAKNLFGALQVFRQLLRRDERNPWHLYVRGERWSPNWWRAHCEAYVEANPILQERVTFVEKRIPDLNEWLEDKAYLLSTSFKEAFGYVIGEAAAKGIRPVIQFTRGVYDIWPYEWTFLTHVESEMHFLAACCYEPEQYRAYVAERYPLAQRLEMLDDICFGGQK